jgi:hypothetical protein
LTHRLILISMFLKPLVSAAVVFNTVLASTTTTVTRRFSGVDA